MKILVTGGAGFLGAHLVELLLKQKHEVLVIDSFWTGSSEAIAKFEHIQAFCFMRHDVTESYPSDIEVDQIYHLACPASPKRFPENPLAILRTCFEGTKNALELAKRCNARILLSSTSEVYGDPLVCPQAESYWGNVNSFGPRSCYDEGKRVAEALAYAYRLQFGTEVRIARIFNAYGPGLLPNDGRVVSNFIAAALAGEDIVVTGDGKSSRCFQFVTDCVRGLNLLMNSSFEGPVNIGSDHETSIGELATLVKDLVASKTGQPAVGVTYLPAKQDDPFRRVPNIRLAKEKLEWEPTIGLSQGLEDSVDWYRSLKVN
ncbi:UDP-glucuronic acid decarboxylase 1 [Lambiella insularis]|nr:UDP-glucuronic acid decarboxylase 1 [Lambiella insularis]